MHNILYVDDEVNNLNSFKLLYRRKFNIFTALSGNEGLDILENYPIHLVITDQRMPHMTGVEFLKKVKQKWPDPKYILLTGFTDNEAIKEAINEAGIYWYVNKPFDPEEMEYLMNNALDTYTTEIEKRITEEELRESEAKFKGIFQSLIDVYVQTDLDGNCLLISPSIEKVLGYTQEEFVKRSMMDYYHNPQSREQLRTELIEKGKLRNFITKAKRKDNTIATVSINANLIDNKNGEPVIVEAIIRDITELMDAQETIEAQSERLSLAINASKVGIWDWDIKNDMLIWEDFMYDLYGINKNDFSRAYEAWSHILHPDDKVKAEAEVQLALKGEQDFDTEFRVIWPDQSIRHIRAMASVMRDEDGTPTRMIGANWDITYLKNAERRIQQMNEELERKVRQRTFDLERANNELKQAEKDIKAALTKEKELGELKSRFVSMASHQFRTPLTVIQSNVELMQLYISKLEDTLKEKFERSFSRISKEILRMTELMDDVLILGKINARAVEPDFQWLDIVRLGKELTARLNEIKKVNSKIKFKVRNTPREMWLDEKLVSHSLLNLLHNAQKYSFDRGQVHFVLSFEEEQLNISINDEGLGMSKEDLKNVFQPFYRGGNVAEIPGTGLGMAIALEYIKLNNGDIHIESELNKGTNIEIVFPCKN